MTPLAPKFLDLEPKQFSDPELENLKGSDLLNGTLRSLEGCQNYTKEHRSLFFFYMTVTDKLEFTNKLHVCR